MREALSEPCEISFREATLCVLSAPSHGLAPNLGLVCDGEDSGCTGMGHGDGDCDNDADCRSGLLCGSNNCEDDGYDAENDFAGENDLFCGFVREMLIKFG